MKVDKEALIVNLIVIALALGLCVWFYSRVHEPEKPENHVYIYDDVENL